LRWDFVFIVFICRTIFFTILRFATFTFLRTIFLRKYSCKTNKRLLARKLFDINSNHCFFKISRYAINWAIDWLFRWWSNLIFCSTIVIRSLIKLICSFRKSQNCFKKKRISLFHRVVIDIFVRFIRILKHCYSAKIWQNWFDERRFDKSSIARQRQFDMLEQKCSISASYFFYTFLI
jgi:hypothetical protein